MMPATAALCRSSRRNHENFPSDNASASFAALSSSTDRIAPEFLFFHLSGEHSKEHSNHLLERSESFPFECGFHYSSFHDWFLLFLNAELHFFRRLRPGVFCLGEPRRPSEPLNFTLGLQLSFLEFQCQSRVQFSFNMPPLIDS